MTEFGVLYAPVRLLRVPLVEVLPRVESRVRYVDYIHERGTDLFALACGHDLEGIVGKWVAGIYRNGPSTSWIKVKNPTYTQMQDRHEAFETKRGSRAAPPALVLVSSQTSREYAVRLILTIAH